MRYRVKLMIIITLLIAMSFSVGGTVLIAVSFRAALDEETKSALASFESVQKTLFLLNSLGDQKDFSNLTQALEQMETQDVVNWQALSLCSGDEVIYRSGMELSDPILTPPDGSTCCYTRVEDMYGQGLLVQSSLTAEDRELTLKARFDLSSAFSMLESQQKLFVSAYLVVVLFAVVTSAILSSAMTARLKRLTAAVRKIAGGDLSTRSGIASRDAFGQLSRDFDAMADRLQGEFSQMESEMQRQEAFMGAFAHELKTPMTSIIGFADLLRQGNLDENTRMIAAEHIYSEGKRLEQLSFKLLDLLLLKKDSITMRKVWLERFVDEVDNSLSPVMRKRGVRLFCRAEQKRVSLEPDLVKSLLYNLIDNAAKAMDGEGIIAGSAIAIPGGCQFQVVDNGRGMEKSELTKITEAFYRVDKSRSRKQGGAGLGLALCKQIVELHNGTISFFSEPGKGTRVTVCLYGGEEKK